MAITHETMSLMVQSGIFLVTTLSFVAYIMVSLTQKKK
ncbi:putative holin-like toxin [Brevibacillus formosus]